MVGSSSRYSVRPVARLDSSLDELDPLGFTARQGGRLLPDLDVIETKPDALERLQLVAHGGNRSGKKSATFGYRHVEDIRDGLVL